MSDGGPVNTAIRRLSCFCLHNVGRDFRHRGAKVKSYISKILVWLFVINLGIVFGAALYEARIEFPQWLA
jgi:hypothetical protein